MLEEAFQKNATRELQNISFLKKDGNPANLEAIYKGYSYLKNIHQILLTHMHNYLMEH